MSSCAYVCTVVLVCICEAQHSERVGRSCTAELINGESPPEEYQEAGDFDAIARKSARATVSRHNDQVGFIPLVACTVGLSELSSWTSETSKFGDRVSQAGPDRVAAGTWVWPGERGPMPVEPAGRQAAPSLIPARLTEREVTESSARLTSTSAILTLGG